MTQATSYETPTLQDEIQRIKNEEPRYETAEQFETAIRNGDEISDYIWINNVLYTMDNYDMTGEEINYGNKTDEMEMVVRTANRYSDDGFSDAEVEIREQWWYRTDITYMDEYC